MRYLNELPRAAATGYPTGATVERRVNRSGEPPFYTPVPVIHLDAMFWERLHMLKKQTLMILGAALVFMTAHADEPTPAPDLQQKPAQAAVQGAAPAQPETPRAGPAPAAAQPGSEPQARRTGGAAAAAGESGEQRKPPAFRNKNADGRYGAPREGAREGKAGERAAGATGSKDRMSPYERRNKQRAARGNNKKYARGDASAPRRQDGN